MNPNELQPNKVSLMEERPAAEVLSQAFTSFHEASKSLERRYRSLETQIQQLRDELHLKNQALLENAREKAALEELAERRNRFTAMGEMVVRMVHDIRNPLGSIELLSSLLRKELAEDEDRKQLSEQIIFGVRTINHALSNLLLFTQIPKPMCRDVSLQLLLDDTLQVIAPTARRREIRLRSERDTPIRCCVDASLFKQVFINLFLNAIQSMPQGGDLVIRAQVLSAEGLDQVEVHVIDTGEGVPVENRQRIFDPFFSTRDKGAGLGLTIAHNILQAHGGLIWVESSEGPGSHFIVRVPAG